MTTLQKIQDFAKLVEVETIERLKADGFTAPVVFDGAKTKVKAGKKFAKVDVGSSGRYMVEMETGNIFGIKGYGVVHRGHFYGTVETTSEYFWGDFYPSKKDGSLKTQKANGCPVITKAPEPVGVTEVKGFTPEAVAAHFESNCQCA